MMRQDEVIEKLKKEGLACRIVPAERFGDLKEVIESLHRQGLFAEGIYEEHYARFNYELPKEASFAKSILSVAVPVPANRITFIHGGKEVKTLLPPTYADGDAINKSARARLSSILKPYRFVWEPVPFKTLAVKSGLAKYGRNNITYVGEHGSFNRLTAFFSDLPCEEDHWQESEALPECEKCRACRKACPTGAISDDRFLVRIDRCITCMNERPGSRPFPDWVRPEWHNAIAGCMHCQNACPRNRKVIGWAEDRASFSEEETAYLLGGKFEGQKAESMTEKLSSLGLDLGMFPRNLEAILNSPRFEQLQSSHYFKDRS